MHQVSRKVLVTAVAGLVVASLGATAGAHNGKGGGRKPMGTVASFDGTTLTVTTTAGDTVTATVTEETKIKAEHRGHHGRGKGHGNPSRGTAGNLTPGTFVLDMKVDDEGKLERIRVRSAKPHDAEPHTPEPTATATVTPTETPTPTP